MLKTIGSFIARWSKSAAAERANKDHFVLDLCESIDVPKPEPTTGDPDQDRYVFEHDANFLHDGGKITIGKIDPVKDFVIFDGERLNSNHCPEGRTGIFCVFLDTQCFFRGAEWQCLSATSPRAGFSSADLSAQ